MTSLIGLTLEEAKKYHQNIRVIKENDTFLIYSGSFWSQRLNVETVNGRITKIVSIG